MISARRRRRRGAIQGWRGYSREVWGESGGRAGKAAELHTGHDGRSSRERNESCLRNESCGGRSATSCAEEGGWKGSDEIRHFCNSVGKARLPEKPSECQCDVRREREWSFDVGDLRKMTKPDLLPVGEKGIAVAMELVCCQETTLRPYAASGEDVWRLEFARVLSFVGELLL